jgi:flagellar hook assembly protein FlgD
MAYEDLLKDDSVGVDNNSYFLVTITDLDINTSYPLQFRWKYDDGSYGAWSAVRIITTPGESTPGTPSTLSVNGGAGIITVTWDGKDSLGNTMSNIDRLDVYIDGSPFDGTKATASFFTAGTKTIVAPAGTYIVAGYAVSKAGTKSAVNVPVTITVTSNVPTPSSSVTPSTPTVSSVLGAIQLSWDGKTSSGENQPYGFDAAKVYVGTSSGFTPSSSNQVDTLNFANGQNTLNIGVGTVVNGSALTYGTDYYVKIATTNGTDTSTPVSASGNPVRIGQVTSGDIVTITADKIATGTLSSSSTITVGATSGKHVILAGTGDPFTIYDTNGTTKLLSYSTTSGKLSIVGDGSFTGNLAIGSSDAIFKAEPATGIWLGNATYSSAPFSVSTNGVIKANSGTIGGWTLASSYLENSAQTFQINSNASTMYIGPYSSGDHIRISASGGIQHTNSSGSATGKFTLTPSGSLTLSGTFTINGTSTIDGTAASTVKSGAATGGTAVQPGNGVSLNGSNQITTITPSSGLTISTASSGSRVEINNFGLKAYSGSTNTVSINSDGSASFTGVITTQAGGSIGGFNIGTSYISTSDASSGYRISTDGRAVFGFLTADTATIASGLTLSSGTSAVSAGGNNFNNVGNLNSPSGNISTTNGNISSGGTISSTGNATFSAYIYNPGYQVSTSGGAARINDASTPTARLVAASGSSIRFKKDIVDIIEVEQLNPKLLLNAHIKAFKYREDYLDVEDERFDKLIPGFIAEELDEIYPVAVDHDIQGRASRWSSDFIVPSLLWLIQQHENEILTLKTRLDALEG